MHTGSTSEMQPDPDLTVSVPPLTSPDASGLFQSIKSLQSWLEDGNQTKSHAMVGASAAMQDVFRLAEQYARSFAPVLVCGESGTGKEGLARMIHAHSDRAAGPYARVNCAALSDGVLESELFGHERGAFTGAVERRVGRFEWASGGTLLLDEISEMPLPLQAKLLRVLEEAEFQRVGSNETIATDVRIIATSNRNLLKEVREGRFRNDLFYRVNVLELQVPPLRERRDDIAELTLYFAARFRHEGSPAINSVQEEAIQKLCEHTWPGNVRELRNVVRRACVLAERGTIACTQFKELPKLETRPSSTLTEMKLGEAERHLILAALERNRGNKTAAARELGVTARTLQNKMRRYREQGLDLAVDDDATRDGLAW